MAPEAATPTKPIHGMTLRPRETISPVSTIYDTAKRALEASTDKAKAKGNKRSKTRQNKNKMDPLAKFFAGVSTLDLSFVSGYVSLTPSVARTYVSSCPPATISTSLSLSGF